MREKLTKPLQRPKKWFLHFAITKVSGAKWDCYEYLEHDPKIIMGDVTSLIEDGVILQMRGRVEVKELRVECEGKVLYEWSRKPKYMDLRTSHDPFRTGPYRYEDSRSPAGPAMYEPRTRSASAPIVRIPIYNPMDWPSFLDSSRSGPHSTPGVRTLEVRLDQPLPTGLSPRDTYVLQQMQKEYFQERDEEERRGAFSRTIAPPSSTFEPYDWRSIYDPLPKSPRRTR